MTPPNPNDFQHQAETWIGIIGGILLLLIQWYFNLKHKWEIEEIKARQNRQGAAIKDQTATVTQVALAVGPVKPKEEEAA